MEKRTYEVSIWTLQDDFITVLKWANQENKGQIQQAKFKNNTDGTQNLSFSIPMYLYQRLERIENPIWRNVINGDIVADLRKIKLIFNKGDQHENSHEKVYEFLITKVTESHENGELTCNVECEGLGFHELGKVGYKVELNGDVFIDDYNDWKNRQEVFESAEAISNSAAQVEDPEPFANLQHWLDKFLAPYPTNGPVNPRKWYYQINMNWEGYSYCRERDPTKIYEEEYAAAWTINNEELEPTVIHQFEEKARLVDLSESNYYNLTQELAEKFGVFCRYEYDHDENYHIIGRRVVFYNSFYQEQDGYLDITYPHSTSSVSREADGTQVTTKLFVRPVNDNNSDEINILYVDANKSLEDYILNFDYLHDIKSISEEQYAAIKEFEAAVRAKNEEIHQLQELWMAYSIDEPIYKAKKTTLENAINLDLERITKSEELKRAVTQNGVITVGQERPDTGILLDQEGNDKLEADQRRYYLKLHQKGILIYGNEREPNVEPFKMFRTYNFIPKEGGESLSDQIVGWHVVYDEAGNPTEIRDIPLYYLTPIAETTQEENSSSTAETGNNEVSGDEDENPAGSSTNEEQSSEEQTVVNPSKMVYLTYSYSPELYYQRITELWTKKAEQDRKDKESVDLIVDKFRDVLLTFENLLNKAYREKAALIKEFEEMMGPALREGYWQPEDYKDYGDHYFEAIANPQTYPFQEYTYENDIKYYHTREDPQPYYGSTPYFQFIWDMKPFDGELLSYYTIKATEEREYYPIYNLNHLETPIYNFIKRHHKDLTFGFYEKSLSDTARLQQRTMFNIGSQLEFAFVRAEYDESQNDYVGGMKKADGQVCFDVTHIVTEDDPPERYNLQISYEAAPCLVLTGAKNLVMDTDSFIDYLKTYDSHPIITNSEFYELWMSVTNNKVIENGHYVYNDKHLPAPNYYDDEDTEMRHIITYEYITEPITLNGIDCNHITGIEKIEYAISVSEAIGDDIQEWINIAKAMGAIANEEQVLFFLGFEWDYQNPPAAQDIADTTASIIAMLTKHYGNYASYQNYLYPNTEQKQILDSENNVRQYALNANPMLVYPRIQINSLKLKNNENDLVIKIQNVLREYENTMVTKLNNYEDYSVLERTGFIVPIMDKELTQSELEQNKSEEASRKDNGKPYYDLSYPTFENAWISEKTDLTQLSQYVEGAKYYISIKPRVFFEAGIEHLDRFALDNHPKKPTTLQSINVYYVLSNADQAIYLDALQVAKENAYPKISYTITPTFYTNDRIHIAYNLLGKIVHINDIDLHFDNITGYISGLELDLDHPENDSYEIQNYKTKFEDLFSTIFAQSQDMKKTAVAMDVAASAFSVNGTLSEQVITNSLTNAGINFSYNDGYFRLSDTDGLIGVSDTGAVSLKHNGIFTATTKVNDEWQWRAAITPTGISADLITEGQIDLSKLKIYSGNEIAFQINENGIFAYKNLSDDKDYLMERYADDSTKREAALEALSKTINSQENDVDNNQYVQFNKYGLALVAQEGAKVFKTIEGDSTIDALSSDDTTGIYTTIKKGVTVKRVQVGWDGLTLRNWNNEKVFYADADTGNLIVNGTIEARRLQSFENSVLDIYSDSPNSTIQFGRIIELPDDLPDNDEIEEDSNTDGEDSEFDPDSILHEETFPNFSVGREGEVLCQSLTTRELSMPIKTFIDDNTSQTLFTTLNIKDIVVSAVEPDENYINNDTSQTLWIYVPNINESGGTTPPPQDAKTYVYEANKESCNRAGSNKGQYEYYLLVYKSPSNVIPAQGTYTFTFSFRIYNQRYALNYYINGDAQYKTTNFSEVDYSADPNDWKDNKAGIIISNCSGKSGSSTHYVNAGGYYTISGTFTITNPNQCICIWVPINKKAPKNASGITSYSAALENKTFTATLSNDAVAANTEGDANNQLSIDTDTTPSRLHECKIYYIE